MGPPNMGTRPRYSCLSPLVDWAINGEMNRIRRSAAASFHAETTLASVSVMGTMQANEVSDGDEPPLTWQLTLSRTAHPRSLDRLVRPFPFSFWLCWQPHGSFRELHFTLAAGSARLPLVAHLD